VERELVEIEGHSEQDEQAERGEPTARASSPGRRRSELEDPHAQENHATDTRSVASALRELASWAAPTRAASEDAGRPARGLLSRSAGEKARDHEAQEPGEGGLAFGTPQEQRHDHVRERDDDERDDIQIGEQAVAPAKRDRSSG